MQLTAALYQKLMPKAPVVYLSFVIAALDKIQATTPERIAMFMAETGVESQGHTRFTENLNYSAERLLQVFEKYYKATPELAAQHAYKPQLIANHVYANRLGNGTEASGEGYKYRGRSAIMTTGKNNYHDVSLATGLDCVNNPDLLAQPVHAFDAAVVYWNKHGVNAFADKGDITGGSVAINGGTIGLVERKTLYGFCLPILRAAAAVV